MLKTNCIKRLINRLTSPRNPSRRKPRGTKLPRYADVLEDRSLLAAFIAIGSDAGIPAEVKIFADNEQGLVGTGYFETETTDLPEYSFNPFPNFMGGVRVAMGDFDGDFDPELVVAAGPGGGPHVMIYELTSGGLPGAILDSFFAYDAGFSGGVNIATGDIDNDGRDELFTAADFGGGPHVRMFNDIDSDGRVSDGLRAEHIVFAGGFTGGVRLAVGDLDSDGNDELITAQGPGGTSEVRIWDNLNGDGSPFNDGSPRSLSPYVGFSGGVYVATGLFQGAGLLGGADLVTSAGAGGGPHVKIYADGGLLFDQFFAYDAAFTGGVRVSTGFTIPGEFSKIVTTPGPGGGTHVKLFADNGDPGHLISDNLNIGSVPVPNEFFVSEFGTSGSFSAVGYVTASQYSYGGFVPRLIPEGTGNFLSVSIFVPSSAGIIRDLDVSLSIQHLINSDLTVRLTHNSNLTSQSRLLINRDGNNDDGFFVRFDDEASTRISSVPNDTRDLPVIGQYRPTGTTDLSDFDGRDASGLWTLTITDFHNLGFYGNLLEWSLHFDH